MCRADAFTYKNFKGQLLKSANQTYLLKSFLENPEVFVQIRGILFCRHLIHPRSASLADFPKSFLKKFLSDPMSQCGEYHIWIAAGLFRNLLEFR